MTKDEDGYVSLSISNDQSQIFLDAIDEQIRSLVDEMASLCEFMAEFDVPQAIDVERLKQCDDMLFTLHSLRSKLMSVTD